jgi:hypothetical protein
MVNVTPTNLPLLLNYLSHINDVSQPNRIFFCNVKKKKKRKVRTMVHVDSYIYFIL